MVLNPLIIRFSILQKVEKLTKLRHVKVTYKARVWLEVFP